MSGNKGLRRYGWCGLCDSEDVEELQPLGVGGVLVCDDCYDGIMGKSREGFWGKILRLVI